MSFWKHLAQPIMAMAPMDGVTDAPFRFITAKYGRPDILFTEFANVEGLARNSTVMLDDFLYDEIERPVVAQIYGSEPESFYKIAIVVCELGFDGIDLNMGCPAKKVAGRGCGAGLIRNPPLAKKIIRQVKKGVEDWVAGRSLEHLGLATSMIHRIETMKQKRPGKFPERARAALPISVKTRIGYDHVEVEDWVSCLLEEGPVAISIHGRTLKQMYSGQADWDAIARAAEIIRKTPTLVLGNGDLKTARDIVDKIRFSGVHGVLLGRGSMGNPWIFLQKEKIRNYFLKRTFNGIVEPEPSPSIKFEVLLEHARHFEKIKGSRRFSAMRKHFGWYCKGMPKAAELRSRICRTNDSQEVERIIRDYQKDFPQIFANR